MTVAAMPPIAQPVERALRAASAATGTPFAYLVETARRESSFDPAARAETSSATGLFQFIDSTWLATVKTYGARHGLADAANAITREADGSYRVADPAVRQAILNLRSDPDIAAAMAAELAGENGRYLASRLGRPATAGELYVAHFLGSGNAARLIEAGVTRPDAIAEPMFPTAAAANPAIFRDRAGQPRTVAQVLARLTEGYGTEVLGTPRLVAEASVALQSGAGALFAGAPSGVGAISDTSRVTPPATGPLVDIAALSDALLPFGAVQPLPEIDRRAGRPSPGAIGPLDLGEFLRLSAAEA